MISLSFWSCKNTWHVPECCWGWLSNVKWSNLYLLLVVSKCMFSITFILWSSRGIYMHILYTRRLKAYIAVICIPYPMTTDHVRMFGSRLSWVSSSSLNIISWYHWKIRDNLGLSDDLIEWLLSIMIFQLLLLSNGSTTHLINFCWTTSTPGIAVAVKWRAVKKLTTSIISHCIVGNSRIDKERLLHTY